MKKYLTIILVLFTTIAFSQTTGQKVVVKVQGAVTASDVSKIVKDSIDSIQATVIKVARPLRFRESDSTLVFQNDTLPAQLTYESADTSGMGSDDKNIPSVGWVNRRVEGLSSKNIDTVSTTSELVSYDKSSEIIYVTDTLQEGLFYWVSSVESIDNGIVFSATGKGSGYWVRIYDKSKGVNVDWWGDRTDVAINKAVTFTGVNGLINFTPNATYTLSNGLSLLDGQIFNGNGATLKRANDSVVTLTADVLSTDSSFTVNAIPSSWGIAGVYQFFSDSTNTNQNVTITKSVSIIGNTVKLAGTIGRAWSATTTFVRRSFTMISCLYKANIKIMNLKFDGNKLNTSRNVSWLPNTSILAYGYGNILIEGCTFDDIPNENITGHGLRVINNNANNLNGSFVHLSFEADRVPFAKPTIISGNITKNTNAQTINSGHAEGVITNSFTPGYVTITNNRFISGGAAGVFGYMQSDSNAADGAYRNVVIANNYAEDFDKIFYSLSILPSLNRNGHIFVQGNVFNDCGDNDWLPYKDSIDLYTDSIMIGSNMLVGGTVWKIPIQKSDSLQRYIINNPTGYPQGGEINISGKGSFGDTLRISKLPEGVVGDSVIVTNSKIIKKLAYSALGFIPISGYSNISGNLIFNNNLYVGGRLTNGTAVTTVWLDNSNNVNIGSSAISNMLLYSNNDFVFYTGSQVEKFRIKENGHTLIGTSSDNGIDLFQVNGTAISTQYKLSALNTAPSSSSDTGTLGEIRVTSAYIYVCTATNTWVRAALSTW